MDVNTFEWDGAYQKDANNVYYNFQKLEDSDPSSFIYLSASYGYSGYSKDFASVFYEGEKIETADAATFQIIEDSDEYDAQDKNHKYLHGEVVE
jgi:hypothetical protein